MAVIALADGDASSRRGVGGASIGCRKGRRIRNMRAIVFHNPTAGRARVSKDSLLAAFQHAGLDPVYCSTKDDDVTAMLREPAELLIIAGGDGTVSKVITRMPDFHVPVAIVPLGNANNIARSLGVAGTPRQLAESWRPDRVRRLDVGMVSGRFGRRKFVEAVGAGPFAKAIQQGAVGKMTGMANLPQGRMLLRQALQEAMPLDLNIFVDGQPLAGELLAAEFANAAFAGPGLPLAPLADPGDGVLDVVGIAAGQRDAVLSWIEAPQSRQLPFVVLRGRKVAFTWQGSPLRIDDQCLDAPAEMDIVTVEPSGKAAKVLVPPGAGPDRGAIAGADVAAARPCNP
jgi:diacylglycerol kinase (ATP)